MRGFRGFLGLTLTLALPWLCCTAVADAPTDLYGAWVLKVGTRNLMVLTLKPGQTIDLPVAGDLVHPKAFSVTDGDVYSQIELPNVDFPIVASTLHGDHLRLSIATPGHPGEKDDYNFTFVKDGEATLAAADGGPPPWTLRHAGTQAAAAEDWDSHSTYSDGDAGNPEMKRIFAADQAARTNVQHINEATSRQDEDRRAAVRKLLADGALGTGEDFEFAAFVFQHGDKPDDYLLAHTLAMVAVSKGRQSATWIAAATLDRYLMSIGQPQIYGTQYGLEAWSAECKANPKCRQKPTHLEQDPYNRALISDALRKEIGVPAQAKQGEQAEGYKTSH